MSARRIRASSRPKEKQTELELLATVGHELKQPLTLISGITSMLKNGDFSDEEIPEQLEKLQLTSSRMSNLVDSLLYAGKIESNQISLDIQPINIASVVSDIVEQTQPYALRHNIIIDTVVTNELVPAAADAQAMHYALYGVMDVIVRSSKSEVIEVLVHHQEDEIMVTLRDDGEHLPAGSVSSILKRLGKSSQPLSHLPGSAGLSLYVAAVLSDAMNGVFQVQQVKGKRAVSLTVPRSHQMELAL